eukprot:Colp12_sorted_trinity150504_noHs@35149
MQEFPASAADLEVVQSKAKLELCDVAVFVYDRSDPNSFAYVAKLQEKVDLAGLNIPCVFVGTKTDLPPVVQKNKEQPAEYCKELDLPQPIFVSVKTNDSNQIADVFSRIVSEAMHPRMTTAATDNTRVLIRVLKISGVLATLGVAAFVGYRLYRGSR